MIQVHDRLEYLRYVRSRKYNQIELYFRQLIKSFSLAAGIDKALLIFSHDVWDEELNELVR